MRLSRSSCLAVVLMVLCVVIPVMAAPAPAPGHFIHEYYRKQEESQYYGGDRSARSAVHSGVKSLQLHGHLSLGTLLAIGYLLLW